MLNVHEIVSSYQVLSGDLLHIEDILAPVQQKTAITKELGFCCVDELLRRHRWFKSNRCTLLSTKEMLWLFLRVHTFTTSLLVKAAALGGEGGPSQG